MTQFELNKQLYEAVTSSKIDLLYIENLLKLGADPLKSYDKDDADCFTLDDLFCESQDEEFARRLPDIVGLFLDNDMDIDKSEFDVLYCLTWIRNEFGIRTLKLFLDHALSPDYAESFFYHLFGDILQFEIPDAIDIDGWEKRTEYAVKMVLLSASYEQIINNSQYIQDLIETQNNNISILKQFRKWNNYHREFSFENTTEYVDCFANVVEAGTSKVIWSFKLK